MMRTKAIFCIPGVGIRTFSGWRKRKTCRMAKWKETFKDDSISGQSLYSLLMFCLPFLTCMKVSYVCLSQIIRDFLTQQRAAGGRSLTPLALMPARTSFSARVLASDQTSGPGDLPWADAAWHLHEDVSWRLLFAPLLCTRLKENSARGAFRDQTANC